MRHGRSRSTGLVRPRGAKWIAPVALAAALSTVPFAAPATAARAPDKSIVGGTSSGYESCRQYGHIPAGSGNVVIRDDYFNPKLPVCVEADGSETGFTVVRSSIPTSGALVAAFPYELYGCSWGICTPGSRLPARTSAVHGPVTTFRTEGDPAGGWNAAYDLWFASRRITTGQANGAELMVWLRGRWPLASRRIVSVGGVRYYIAHWVASHHTGPTWNYIQFRRVRPADGVTNLKLAPLIAYAERMHWISPRWWWLSIEAGFEIRGGGRGLAATEFSARA
jgi:hypothetical protein